ncbi:MAG: hypothetical protein OJF61_002331 [Rhodanobacteraceae bacterium]|jgi:uncharacterized membrane protein YbhN (UPF0104 family)|nr:MAG: hypothetical protein OJF61_002331 [Rhodanobacteraceae bacterium]
MKRLLLKIIVSCVLLALLLWRVPLGEIGAHMRLFHAVTLWAVVSLSLACWGIAAVRQWCLLPEFRYRDLLYVTFIAKFYATILPGQIAGDVVKAYRLGRQSSRAGHAEAATVLDRGLGLLALFIASAIASLYSTRLPMPLRLFFICGAIGVATGGAAIGSPLFRGLLIERLLAGRRGRIAAFIHEFSLALHDQLRRPGMLLAAMLPAILFHGVCIAMQVLLGDDLGIKLGWADWTVIYAGVSLLMLLPVSVAGLGLREGGYVGLLALFGYKASAALSLSFVILGAALVAALVGGGLELVSLLNRVRASSDASHHSSGR